MAPAYLTSFGPVSSLEVVHEEEDSHLLEHDGSGVHQTSIDNNHNLPAEGDHPTITILPAEGDHPTLVSQLTDLKNTISKSPTILSGALSGLKIKIARSTSPISGSTTPKLVKPNLDAKSASDQAPHEGNSSDLAGKSPMRTMMESLIDQGKTLIKKIRKNSSRKGSMESN